MCSDQVLIILLGVYLLTFERYSWPGERGRFDKSFRKFLMNGCRITAMPLDRFITFLPAARYEHAGLQVHFVLPSFLPFFLWKGSRKQLGARKALEHGLLRPLISELRSEVTSEATGSLRGHFQRNSHSSGSISQLLIAPSFLLHSLVVKVSDFGARGPWFKSHLWQSKNVTNVLILWRFYRTKWTSTVEIIAACSCYRAIAL